MVADAGRGLFCVKNEEAEMQQREVWEMKVSLSHFARTQVQQKAL